MFPEKDENAKIEQDDQQEEEVVLHNPFDPNNERTFNKEDLENEQKFKEALTERD